MILRDTKLNVINFPLFGLIRSVYLIARQRIRCCPDTEAEQAIVRIAVVSILFVYLAVTETFSSAGSNSNTYLLFTWASVATSVGIFLWIVIFPKVVVT